MTNQFQGVPEVAPPSMPTGATTNLSQTSLKVPPVLSQKPSLLSQLSSLAGSVAGTGVIGSTIGVLGNLVGDAINYKRQKDMYSIQREDALEDYGRQRADYLSDLANERAYNSPLAQVARLKEAGINPNVAFGSGSPANTSSSAQNNATVAQSSFGSPAGSSLGSVALQGASGLIQSSMAGIQAQQMKEDIALKKAQAIGVLSNAKLTLSQEARQKIENSFLGSVFAADIAEKQARTNQLIDSLETASLARLSAQYDLYHLKPVQKQQVEAAIAQYYANVRSINQQSNYFDSVKNVRQRNEIIDMKRNSYKMAEDHFRRDIFKALGNRRDADGLLGDLAFDTGIIFNYLWNFK